MVRNSTLVSRRALLGASGSGWVYSFLASSRVTLGFSDVLLLSTIESRAGTVEKRYFIQCLIAIIDGAIHYHTYYTFNS